MKSTLAATLLVCVSLQMVVSGCAQQGTVGPATTGPPPEAPSVSREPTATETAPPTPTGTVTAPLPTPTSISTHTPTHTPTQTPTTTPIPAEPVVFQEPSVHGDLEIFIRNADGSVANLTNHPSEDAYPDLSPDGMRIVFASDRDGPTRVFVMNIDGSNLTRLTDSQAGDTRPTWSVDGTRILYSTLFPDHNWEIYVMNADGSAQTNLTNNPAAYDISPTWFSDGTQIFFQSDRDGERFDYKPYVMNVDGSDVRKAE